jgi:type IX secretion system PorP/SprF family membrane protein
MNVNWIIQTKLITYVNKIFFGLALCWLIQCFNELTAQNADFSQFHNAPAQTNPAMIAKENQMQAIINYRNQSIGGGQAYQTPMVSFIYPWIKGGVNRRGAISASFIQDKTGLGGILVANGALLTAAGNFNLTPEGANATRIYNYKKYISIGLQGGFFQRNVDLEALQTGAQYLGNFTDGLGDSDIAAIANQTKTFPLFNAGGLFYMADACGNTKAYFGIAAQNINQPNVAFFDSKDKMSLKLNLTTGINFNLNPSFSVQPNMRLIQQKNAQEIRIGALTYYNYGGGTGFFSEGKVGVGAWYDSNKQVTLALDVNQPTYQVGFSYDLGATSSLNKLGGGVWELSFAVKFGRKCLDERRSKEPIKDTMEVEVRVTDGVKKITLVATLDENKEVLSTDTLNVEFIPDVIAEDILIPTDEDLKILKKHAFFYYLSDDINKASASLLDQIVEMMTKFKGIKIKINGHTCDIGATEEINQALAIKRANAVKNYFISKGVVDSRVQIEGYGSAQPVLSNKTEYGRIKNRRVEFEVLATGAENKGD